MISRKRRTIALAMLVMDSLAAAFALLAAWYLRFAVEVIPVTKGAQDLSVYSHLLPIVMIVVPIVFSAHGMYRLGMTRGWVEESIGAGLAVLTSTIVISGLLLWIRPADTPPYSRATVAIFAICTLLFVLIFRWLIRAVVAMRIRRGKGVERVLVVGSGEIARAVVSRIESHSELGLLLSGYVGEQTSEIEVPWLGEIQTAASAVRAHQIQHVYVALPQQAGAEMNGLLVELSRELVNIHVVPDLLQFMALQSRVEDLDGLPTVNLSETPLSGVNLALKRVFDILIGTVALVLAIPVMIVIGLAVKLEDRGPILYRQRRMGLDGIAFSMYKFRSMAQDAEKDSGAVWASSDDERRTRVGRLLRAWSLDELPQLLNVVIGEMSLVGPRPERPEFVDEFREKYPHYMLRHKVRAGMTGWAQVHGWRGNTSVKMRVEHDLYYIEHWSMLLDLKILALTVVYGFRNENAY